MAEASPGVALTSDRRSGRGSPPRAPGRRRRRPCPRGPRRLLRRVDLRLRGLRRPFVRRQQPHGEPGADPRRDRLGVHLEPRQQLAPPHVDLPDAGRLAFRGEPWRLARRERRLPCRKRRPAAGAAAGRDRRSLAQRRGSGLVRPPPPPRGVGGLDRGAQGRAVGVLRPADARGLRRLDARTATPAVRDGPGPLRPRPHGQADARHLALRAAPARPLALAAHGHRPRGPPRPREGTLLRAFPPPAA